MLYFNIATLLINLFMTLGLGHYKVQFTYSLNEEYQRLYKEDFFLKSRQDKGEEAFFVMVTRSFRTLVAITEKFGSTELAERVANYQPKIMSELARIFLKEESKFDFVTHGDAWFNNFLFK